MSSDIDVKLSALKFLTSGEDNICRLCFSSTTEEEVTLDDCVTIKSRHEENVSFLDMFRELGVQLEPSLPQTLCIECATLTTNSYIFQKVYQDSKKNWDLALDRLSASLDQSETAGPNTQTLYFMITNNGNGMFTSSKRHTHKSKKTVLNKIKDALKAKPPSLIRKRKKSNFICDECGEKFTANCHLIKHMRVHSNNKFPCPWCPKVFSSQSQLDHHDERIHYPKKLKCPKCSKMFSTDKMLNYHDKLHHMSALCKICFVQFPSKKELRLHLDKHEMNKCPRCSKSFANKNSFKLHLKICGIEKNYPKFFCDICNKGYIRKNGIRTHIKTDHGFGKVLTCNWCGKKYDAISKLKIHIVKHTKEKNYHCEHCGGKFVTHAALIYHIRLHTGEKPFPCDICNESFLSASRRMEHKRRKHIGPTKECHVCHIKFFTKHQLTKHVERHFNPHSKLFVPMREEPYITVANNIKEEQYPMISRLLSI